MVSDTSGVLLLTVAVSIFSWAGFSEVKKVSSTVSVVELTGSDTSEDVFSS